MNYLSVKRKRYYTFVFTYKIRREKLRRKYGIDYICNCIRKLPEGYVKKANSLTLKISMWNRAIKRIDTTWDKLYRLERTVVLFTGVEIKKQYGRVSKEVKLAKQLYYKFGAENGLKPLDLLLYIGVERPNRKQLARYRESFTRSFKDVPENKELWLRFKAFYHSPEVIAQIPKNHYSLNKDTKKKR